MKRRRFVGTAAVVVSLAGCLSENRVDASGEIEVVVDGDSIDLGADRFQAEHASDHSRSFHLHEGTDQWFMEGNEPVTFGEAIALLPHFEFEQGNGDPVVTIDGDTYDANDAGTTIEFSVDDEPVDPTTYELEDGDRVTLTVTTGGA